MVHNFLLTQLDEGGVSNVEINSFLYSCILTWRENKGMLLLVKIT